MLSNSVAELDSSVAECAMFFQLFICEFSVAEWMYSVADFAQEEKRKRIFVPDLFQFY